MNYLKLKEKYPNGMDTFFDWLSDIPLMRHSPAEYADNAYTLWFFWKTFDYNHIDKSIVIDRRHYVTSLQELLLSNSREFDGLYWVRAPYDNIVFGKYEDSHEQFVKIIVKNENNYEGCFYILEIIINNGWYD